MNLSNFANMAGPSELWIERKKYRGGRFAPTASAFISHYRHSLKNASKVSINMYIFFHLYPAKVKGCVGFVPKQSLKPRPYPSNPIQEIRHSIPRAFRIRWGLLERLFF